MEVKILLCLHVATFANITVRSALLSSVIKHLMLYVHNQSINEQISHISKKNNFNLN
jgi:hypothetical protein